MSSIVKVYKNKHTPSLSSLKDERGKRKGVNLMKALHLIAFILVVIARNYVEHNNAKCKRNESCAAGT